MEEKETNTTDVCKKCGETLSNDQMFCSKCGTPKGEDINQVNANVNTTKQKKSNAPLIITIVGVSIFAFIAIVAIIVISLGGMKKNFKNMYGSLESEKWCTIASDGSWMKLDTNPDDDENDDFDWNYYSTVFSPCNDQIEKVNSDLGFSSVVYEKMNETTWSQGRQTEENSKYKVSWTYHPDKGLEVIYEIKK